MANQTGIEISIKAWLPTGKGLDEQFTALSLVKAAHESGDYAPLLKAATIEGVKTESKTRRMEVVPEPAAAVATKELAPELYTPTFQPGDIMPGNFLGENPHIDGNQAIADTPEPVQAEILGTELPNPTRRGRRAA